MNQCIIFIIDDELNVLRTIERVLKKENYITKSYTHGYKALEEIKQTPPDLILLDLVLPDINGLEICNILKNDEILKHIPVIMLTGRISESDIISGLKSGADDYITKPFSNGVLIARIEAALRRIDSIACHEEVIKKAGISISISEHKAKINNKYCSLSKKEFDLLCLLIKKAEKVLSRDYLMEMLWPYKDDIIPKTLDININRLRKKLGKEKANYIKTIRGIGYKFSTEKA